MTPNHLDNAGRFALSCEASSATHRGRCFCARLFNFFQHSESFAPPSESYMSTKLCQAASFPLCRQTWTWESPTGELGVLDLVDAFRGCFALRSFLLILPLLLNPLCLLLFDCMPLQFKYGPTSAQCSLPGVALLQLFVVKSAQTRFSRSPSSGGRSLIQAGFRILTGLSLYASRVIILYSSSVRGVYGLLNAFT